MLILLDIGGVAFLFSLLLTPFVRDFALRRNLVDRPDHRKIHRQAIPRLGGVAIAIAYVLAYGFILIAPYRNVRFDIGTVVPHSMILLPAAALVFAVGLLDDLFGLKPWHKLAAEVAAASLAYLAGVHIETFHWHTLGWLSFPITVLWLVGCTNAFNLIDGLDGLAAGVGLFATVTTLIAALTHNNLELGLATAPLVGCLLGFLRYNFNPASIFLGDCGSLLIGFLLGCYGVLWTEKSATLLGLTAPMMAMAIPLLDVALSIVRRFLRNQPIFAPDRRHIHHRLLDLGFTPRRAALLLYGICAIAAALSLLQDLAHDRAGGVIIVLFCAVAWVGVQHLGYTEFGMARRLVTKGTLRGFIDVQVRLQELERELKACSSDEQITNTLVDASRQFGFRAIRLRLHGQTLDRHHIANSDASGWQMRIDLPNSQYVNLYGHFDGVVHPGLLAGFAQIVERTMAAGASVPDLIAQPIAIEGTRQTATVSP